METRNNLKIVVVFAALLFAIKLSLEFVVLSVPKYDIESVDLDFEDAGPAGVRIKSKISAATTFPGISLDIKKGGECEAWWVKSNQDGSSSEKPCWR